jgi:serine/threonine-protein kinase
MAKIAEISARIALIQHDNVLDIQNFLERDRIRMMIMEWVDGYDLGRLIRPNCLSNLERRVTVRRWRYINDVILTSGPTQSRFKPGVAVAIVRDCLGALAALHREGIVHGDVKPSNIMIKRTGHCRLIDMGSALDYQSSAHARYCTPQYAAPEVLETRFVTPLSDLAIVGYVLVELLSVRTPFPGQLSQRALLQAKLDLPQRLCELLPQEVILNELLMNFLLGLISPDPNSRFPSAEAADLVDRGAAAFQRQLIIGNMASEYGNDLRLWLEELRHLEV